jgi:glycosyltransferase involved in cell wall biosynthesis
MPLAAGAAIHHGPTIEPVGDAGTRPDWSVMIPTFNCARFLRQTLGSVLSQDLGRDRMQIEVVDDCSTVDRPEVIVEDLGRGRVNFHRTPRNEGPTATFNRCIRRSRGKLVHILHGDDYVLPGFYAQVAALAARYPDLSLLATRSFFVDEEGVIAGVTSRVRGLEDGGHSVDDFYRGLPVQCAGVVVRRSFYERNGGFVRALTHTADWEMWTRAVAGGGGLVSPQVLACYRVTDGNDTGRLMRTGENLRDYLRLYDIFASRYPGWDRTWALNYVRLLAVRQANRFSERGDEEAYRANLAFWKELTPLHRRLRSYLGRLIRRAAE